MVFSNMSESLHPSPGNSVLYVPQCVRLPPKQEIISFISVKFLSITSRLSIRNSQGWRMIQYIQCLEFIYIGGNADDKRLE